MRQNIITMIIQLNLRYNFLNLHAYCVIVDKSENWDVRIDWLNAVIAELWKSRLSPVPAVLEYIGLNEAIDAFKAQVLASKEKK